MTCDGSINATFRKSQSLRNIAISHKCDDNIGCWIYVVLICKKKQHLDQEINQLIYMETKIFLNNKSTNTIYLFLFFFKIWTMYPLPSDYRCGSWIGIVGGKQSITLQDPGCINVSCVSLTDQTKFIEVYSIFSLLCISMTK